MKSALAAFAIAILLVSGGVQAADCQTLIEQVDSIIESAPGLDEETIVDEEANKTVKKMRTEASAMLEAGNDDACRALMEKALEMLKNQV